MTHTGHISGNRTSGIFIQGDSEFIGHEIAHLLQEDRISSLLVKTICDDGCRFTLQREFVDEWGQDFDTERIARLLNLQPERTEKELELEIAIAMLGSPEEFVFSSIHEFAYSIHVRRNIVREAEKTQLAFSADVAERPEEYWRYSEDYGFLVKAGQPIIRALRAATQPGVSGALFSFSCYRATEYVILLALALELEQTDLFALDQLQQQMETYAIKSRRFHDAFLQEYGSMQNPLPKRFYVPGDRVWFRNPDELSSDICGYEGSWVFYLGGGKFSNFWKCSQPYTLETKCVEIFHWRHGLRVDEQGTAQMNEAEVDRLATETLSDPKMADVVLERMLQYRDNSGEYRDGGCIDTTREYPRYIGNEPKNRRTTDHR